MKSKAMMKRPEFVNFEEKISAFCSVYKKTNRNKITKFYNILLYRRINCDLMICIGGQIYFFRKKIGAKFGYKLTL